MPVVTGMILINVVGPQAIALEVRNHAGQQSFAVTGDVIDRQPALALGGAAATDRD